jgi:C1A family cysteine protease
MAGALIVRSSWGAKWGEKGYDFLPYDYVINGLAEDWWTLIQQGWVDTGQFGE